MNETDFYEICLDEGGIYYSDIFSLDKSKFNYWILNNLIEIGTINSFDEVIPNENILNDFNNKGYKHIYNQCHYSAKSITILNEKFKYYTGFVDGLDYPYPIITHSFNEFNGNIIDFSRLENLNDPFNLENLNFPQTYYGIEIPRDFVLLFKNETFNDGSMRPLLYEWFTKSN